MSKISPVSKLPHLFALMFIALFMFLEAAASEGATLSRLRVGYPSPSASFFPLFATKEAGLLEKYGFETEMVYVQGVQLVQVHVAGQLDFSTISSVVYLQASVEGADLIQVASSIDNQLMKLIVHPSIQARGSQGENSCSCAVWIAYRPSDPSSAEELGARTAEGREADSDR